MARLRYLENARTGDPGTICTHANKLFFDDTGAYINASASGTLALVATTVAVTGNQTISGDLNITGALTYGALEISLNQSLQGTLTVGQSGTGYDVKFWGYTSSYWWEWDKDGDSNQGEVILHGKFSQTGNMDISGTLDVSGTVTLTGDIVVTGGIDVDGATVLDDVTIAGTVTQTGNADITGTLDVSGTVTLTGDATVGGTLGVTGTSTLGVVTIVGAVGITGRVTMENTERIDFYDTGQYIYASSASQLDIVGPTIAMAGVITNDKELTVTSTNPAASIEVIDAALTAGGSDNYTATSIKAVKGQCTVATTGDYISNAFGGWFGLKFTSGGTMERQGLAVGLYAEAHTERTQNCQPNAVAYFQSVISGSGLMMDMPILVLTSTGGTDSTDPRYAIEFGYEHSSTTVSAGSGYMFYGNTIKCKINGTDYFMPFSTTEATFTTAYPIATTSTIVSTYSGGNAISVTVTAGTNDAYTGITVNNTCAKTNGGVHKGISSTVTYIPADTGYTTPIGVVGKVTLEGSDSFTGGTGAMYGVQGQLDFGASSAINDATSIFAGLRGVITGAPTCTAFSVVAGLYVDNLATGDLTGGEYGSCLAAFTNHGYGIDHAIMIFGALGGANNSITNLFSIQGDPAFLSSGTATGVGRKFQILIGADTYYINAYVIT